MTVPADILFISRTGLKEGNFVLDANQLEELFSFDASSERPRYLSTSAQKCNLGSGVISGCVTMAKDWN